jgi:hypothetical protein
MKILLVVQHSVSERTISKACAPQWSYHEGYRQISNDLYPNIRYVDNAARSTYSASDMMSRRLSDRTFLRRPVPVRHLTQEERSDRQQDILRYR